MNLITGNKNQILSLKTIMQVASQKSIGGRMKDDKQKVQAVDNVCKSP